MARDQTGLKKIVGTTTAATAQVKSADKKDEKDDRDDEDEKDEEDEETPLTFAPPSKYGQIWTRLLRSTFRFALIECPFGSKHWFWDRLCGCGFGKSADSAGPDEWHGGIYDMQAEVELMPCIHCFPEHHAEDKIHILTEEEEILLNCWREYRSDVLDQYDEAKSTYKYEVYVHCGDTKTPIMGRTVGPDFSGNRGMFSSSRRIEKGTPN